MTSLAETQSSRDPYFLLRHPRYSMMAIRKVNKCLCSGGGYVEKFLVYNNFFSLLVLLTAHRRLLFKYPSYYFLKLPQIPLDQTRGAAMGSQRLTA
jgi:hypothetical protein